MATSTRWAMCVPLALVMHLWIGLATTVYASSWITGGATATNPPPQTPAIATLGRIVFLPHVTLNDDHANDARIFDGDISHIARNSKESYKALSNNWFENSDLLKQSIGAEMGLSASRRGISYSVEKEFNRISGHRRDVKTAEVHAMRFHSKTFLLRGSREFNNFKLRDDFRSDFHNLPETVQLPHTDNAWAPFEQFMRKWGSHVVYAAYTGSVFQSWSSADASRDYSQHDMTVKACVKAEGMKVQGIVSYCADVTESERRDAKKRDTVDTLRVKGGRESTRRDLENEVATPDLINRFMDEADADEQPVKYLYLPIWEVMLARSDRSESTERRAVSLQAYYNGWKATGCPLVKTQGQSNNHAQMMVPEVEGTPGNAGPSTGYYLCIRRCQGCHSYDDDCHYSQSGRCCSAYGPSAIRVNNSGFADRANQEDQGWCDNNNGCRLQQGSKTECQCSNSNEERGCNYEYPRNPRGSNWLKYKVLWNQRDEMRQMHTLDDYEDDAGIASVA